MESSQRLLINKCKHLNKDKVRTFVYDSLGDLVPVPNRSDFFNILASGSTDART